MERIDQLESQILGLQDLVKNIRTNETNKNILIGESQNLRDKEIIEFIGDKDS